MGSEVAVWDLCVVGAGLFGSAAARHASADPSLKVCLVGPAEPSAEEKPNREIFSCHYDEGRVTRVLDDNPVCQVLAKHAISRYRDLEKLSGIRFYEPLGFLCIGQKGGSFMERMKQNAAQENIPLIDLSHGDLLKKRYPYLKLREDEFAFLEDIGGGHISPRNLAAAQQKVASLQGCHIVREVVERVLPLEGNTHEIVLQSGVILKAKRVLVCAGSFTNFKDLLPVEGKKRPDIEVRMETVAFLRISKSEAERISSFPSIVLSREDHGADVGAYILPPIKYPDGQTYLKIGHFDEAGSVLNTLEEIKNWYLSKGDAEIIESKSKLLMDMIKDLKVEEVTGMTCSTCRSPSGLPYIDRLSPTLALAVVGHGKGAKFSEEVGRIAAKLSVHGKWDSELDREQFRVIWK